MPGSLDKSASFVVRDASDPSLAASDTAVEIALFTQRAHRARRHQQTQTEPWASADTLLVGL